MTRQIKISLIALAAAGMVACGGAQDSTETVSAAEKGDVRDAAGSLTPARPGTMFEIDYRIIGTPVVGSPVAIDLTIRSAFGGEPINISYQSPDETAVLLDEAQPQAMTRTPQADEPLISERVTVIPQREGRLYINVRAARERDDGSQSTMISIPIHVGDVDTSLKEHGVLETNEEGETTRVLGSE